VLVAVQHTQEYENHKQTAMETSEGLRLSFWKHTIELISQHPFIGTGTGSFTKAYQQFAGFTPLTTNPHSEYLLFGVQFGAAGIIFLLVWFTYLAFLTTRIDSNMKFIAQIILASYIIGCMFNSWLHDSVHSYSFVLLLGLLYAKLTPANENKSAVITPQNPNQFDAVFPDKNSKVTLGLNHS
jgi:O-antigen ligase